MRKIKTKIKIEHGTSLPVYYSKDAAGCDLRYFGAEPITLYPLDRACLRTGVSVQLPEGYEAQVRGRSGLNRIRGIVVPTGTIDGDFRGEIHVVAYNLSREPYTIVPGERIAQLVICPVVQAAWNQVDELDGTERGEGGFGSTGND